MKRAVVVTLCFILSLFAGTSFAANVTLFGPHQYVRTTGSPNTFTDSFTAISGSGMLIVKNGAMDGNNRIIDAISSASVYVNGQQIFGPSDFNKNVYLLQASVNLTEDNTITVELASIPGSYLTIEVTEDVDPPTASLNADPETILLGESTTLAWSSTTADACVIEPDIGPIDVSGSLQISPSETTTYTITATGLGGTVTASITITVNSTSPPLINFSSNPGSISSGQSSTLTWTSTNAQSAFIDNSVGSVPVNGSITVSPDHTSIYTITVTGATGSSSAQAEVQVTGNPAPVPEGSFGKHYEDLIPTDSTVNEYDAKRFSLITGLVRSIDDSPIPDVSVTLLGHPEYGTVLTDAKGQFTLPVEGGTTLTVVYQKNGYLTSQRKVYVPWNDIAIAETIQMISQDTAATTVTFDGNPDTVVTHQSTPVTDTFGTRSATMVFTGDNHAYLMDEDGNDVQNLTTITTRATEYTTPESMPAVLPPTSAFTYCVELSVDGAQRVRFEKPVTIWVDNFLGFDVGMAVPVGYYDQDRGVWVPSDNGVVIKLLDTDSDGVVDALDSSGDDLPDDLNGNGVFSDEVKGLEDPQKYHAGDTYWRVAVEHFTPHDINWAARTIRSFTPLLPHGPEGSILSNADGIPSTEDAKNEKPINPPDEMECFNSYVENRTRIFHEDIPIPGVDTTLHYESNRVDGFRHGITVPASGDTVPDGLKRIIVKAEIAGRTFEQILDPLPDQKTEVVWDGLDCLGRKITNNTSAKVNIGFVYDGVYTVPPDLEQAFAMAGRDITSILTRQEVTLWKKSVLEVPIQPRKKHSILAEGWTLSIQHQLDSVDPPILYKGDGTIYRNNAVIVKTVAGNGGSGYDGDGGIATETSIDSPLSVALDSMGNLYIASLWTNRILKVNTEGIITTVAGNGNRDYDGDGGSATEASLNQPSGVAVDSDGNVYIADTYNNRIRKVDTNGIITTVAGNGIGDYNGDGEPAIEASLNQPAEVALDASGNLYIADSWNHCIRKVDTDGIITTMAGRGVSNYLGNSGPATEASLGYIVGIAVDLMGNLYIPDNSYSVIWKVDNAGVITNIAGNGTNGYRGDHGLAVDAKLNQPRGVTVDTQGNIYIADWHNRVVRKVDTNGIITTYAGTTAASDTLYHGDGGPPLEAGFNVINDVAVDPSGNLYIADAGNRVRKVAYPSTFSPSTVGGDIPFPEPNGLGQILSSSGIHKKMIDLETGTVLYEYGYDANNNLISITDQFGNQTMINWNANGVPTSIISPDGLTTSLTIDAANYLSRITYPDGSFYSFEYTSDGLMTGEIEPEGNRFGHSFTLLGRLSDVYDENNGHWNYKRTEYVNGDILTKMLTGEGNLTSFLDHTDSTGAYTSTITGPAGSQTLFSESADGLTVNKTLPCGMDLEYKYGLDSEYKFKFVKEMTETAPSGLEKVTLRNKTYQDTNSDNTPDLITETVKINDKPTTLENNVLQSKNTITSPEGRTITLHYDPSTLVTENMSIPGLFDTSYGYDAKGRLTSVTTNTRQTAFTYTAQGFLESVTDPGGYITTYTHDPMGRKTGISRPDGSSIGFTYDKNGNMTVLTNPATIDQGFSYNKVNLNSSYQTPLSGSYTYVYDKDRRLKHINFPSGNQIENIYANGRLLQIQTPEGNIDYTYLCSTKVDSITKGSESIAYDYDGKLVTAETLSGTLNQTLGYTYNDDFILTSLAYAGGTENYTYDNDDLLTGAGNYTIFRNAGNGLPETIAGGALSLSRTFNGYGEIDEQDYSISGQYLTSWNLTRNNNGRITNKSETVGGITSDFIYTYDGMGRLLTVTKDGTLVEEYQYNANGTRIYEMNSLKGIAGRNFSHDDEDHMLTAGSAIYSYNLDGFLTAKTEGSDVITYDYSSQGELLTVTFPDGRIIDYVYDPLGRRIAKKVNGVIVEKYLWQGLTKLLAVYDSSDNLLMRFEYADSRMPVAMIKGGVSYFLTYDQVGSLRIVADASGSVVKRIDYDSFGNIIDDTNPTFEVSFGFAGGLYDQDTGLVGFGYRDYDPDTGRWTAKDPLIFAGGDTDLYGYCLSDPINFIDSDGLKGGVFIPIRKFIKRNITGGDIIGPILGKGLSIPTSAVGILTYDYLNPKEAGVASEEFLIYQWEKLHNPKDSNFNIQLPPMVEKISTLNNNSEKKAKRCDK